MLWAIIWRIVKLRVVALADIGVLTLGEFLMIKAITQHHVVLLNLVKLELICLLQLLELRRRRSLSEKIAAYEVVSYHRLA